MTSITSASGATYVQVDVDEKATIDEIASAAGISGPGINLYEVQKKEEVSAAKSLLLFVGPTAQWIDGEAARSKLGMSGGKAAVTPALVVSKAGAGSKLWVQSTSSNRALPEGSSLIKAVAGGAGGAGKSGAAKPAAKGKAATKRKADEDEDEAEEEEEEEKPAKKSAQAKRARKDPAAAAAAPAGGKKMTAKERAAAAAMADEPAPVKPDAKQKAQPKRKQTKPEADEDEDEDDGGSSTGNNIKIVGTSGNSYVLIPVAEKATVDEVCAGAGVACNTGLYEVGGKKEDVSAQKELVLLTVPASSVGTAAVNDDYASIRKLLGMGTGKASINAATVKAKAGPHAKLFVQSTSGNRGILAGTLLCVKQDYGFGAGGGAGGVAAAAGSGPVSLASIFAAHYGSGAAAAGKGTPATKTPVNPKRSADDVEVAAMEDEDDSNAEREKDYGFDTPEFRQHTLKTLANIPKARGRFLEQSSLGRWTSSRGNQFLICATACTMNGDWPYSWFVHESQLVVAAAFFLPKAGETDKSVVAPLAMVWLTSLTADESASAYLQAYADDGNELDGLLDGGNEGVLETVVIGLDDHVIDAFCVTSSSDAMPALNCPALEGITVGEIESGRMNDAPPDDAGALSAVSASGSSRLLRSASGDSLYMLVHVSSKSTVAQEIGKLSSVPKSDVAAALYEVADKKEEVSAKKAMVLWNSLTNTVDDDVAAIRTQLGVGAGSVSLNSSQVVARAGDQAKLFVQSTSTNRALQAGSMLCLKLQGASVKSMLASAGASVPVAAAGASSSSSAAAGRPSSSSLPATAANEFMPALQFLDWARLCDLDGGFSGRTIFPADSAWFAERSGASEPESRPIDPARVRGAQELLDKIAAGGFDACGLSDTGSASTAALTPQPEGWFRDLRLEDRIRRQVLRGSGTMAHESLRVTAHAHSSSPRPGSRALVCIEIGKDEGADFLVATNAHQWMVLARHTDGHMMLECNQFEAVLDNSRRIIVREGKNSDDEGKEARGPPQTITDVNSPRSLSQAIERHFKNVVAGKVWA